MFYDKYVALCSKKGVSPTTAAVQMGMSKGTPTTWKKLKTTPQAAQLKKIADYFGVTIDSLMDNEQKEKAPSEGSLSQEELMLLQAFRAANDQAKRTALVVLEHGEQG